MSEVLSALHFVDKPAPDAGDDARASAILARARRHRSVRASRLALAWWDLRASWVLFLRMERRRLARLRGARRVHALRGTWGGVAMFVAIIALATGCGSSEAKYVEVVAGGARATAHPHPPRVGRIDVQLDLPPEFMPDPHSGKRVRVQVRRPGADLAHEQLEALESQLQAHQFTFAFDAAIPGTWRVLYSAHWPDGRLFDEGQILMRVVR